MSMHWLRKFPNPANFSTTCFFANQFMQVYAKRKLGRQAQLATFLDKIPQYLKSSNRIRLNKFGIFKLSFSSVGHEKAEDVSSNDIKSLRVLFTPSAELKKELSDVSYTRK